MEGGRGPDGWKREREVNLLVAERGGYDAQELGSCLLLHRGPPLLALRPLHCRHDLWAVAPIKAACVLVLITPFRRLKAAGITKGSEASLAEAGRRRSGQRRKGNVPRGEDRRSLRRARPANFWGEAGIGVS